MKKFILLVIMLIITGLALMYYASTLTYTTHMMYKDLMNMKEVFTYKDKLNCKAFKEVFTSDNYTCEEKITRLGKKRIIFNNNDFLLKSSNYIIYEFEKTRSLDVLNEGQTDRTEYDVLIQYDYHDQHETKVKNALYDKLKEDHFYPNRELDLNMLGANFFIWNITRRLNPLQIPIDKKARE